MKTLNVVHVLLLLSAFLASCSNSKPEIKSLDLKLSALGVSKSSTDVINLTSNDDPFTLVGSCKSDIKGIEIKDKDGQWINISTLNSKMECSSKGSFTVNIAKASDFLTDGNRVVFRGVSDAYYTSESSIAVVAVGNISLAQALQTITQANQSAYAMGGVCPAALGDFTLHVGSLDFVLSCPENGKWNISPDLSALSEGVVNVTANSNKDGKNLLISSTLKDAIAPSVPSGVSVVTPATTPNNVSALVLKVSGVQAGDTVTLFKKDCIGVMGTAVVPDAATSVNINVTLSNEGVFQFQAKSKDLLGNESACSSSGTSAAYELDQTKPTAVLSSLPIALNNFTSVSIGVSGDADFQSYKYKHLTSASNADCSLNTGYQNKTAGSNIALTGLGAGHHTICVLAVDKAGNIQDLNSSTNYTWEMSTSASTAVIALGFPNADTPVVSSPIYSNNNTMDVIVSGADINEYQYQRTNGTACNIGSASALTPVATRITAAGLADGVYKICVWGKNSLGNIQAIATEKDFRIDKTNPTVVTGLSDGAGINTFSSTTATPAITFTSGTDGGSGLFKHVGQIYNVTQSTIAKSWFDITSGSAVTMGLVNGERYRVDVKAIDKAGNESSVASSDSWVVDTTPATVAFVSPTSATWMNSTTRSNFPVSGSCSEDGRNVTITAKQAGKSDVTILASCGIVTSHTFSANLNLSAFTSEGLAKVTIDAVHADLANNSGSASVTFNEDVTAPVAIGSVALRATSSNLSALVSASSSATLTPFIHFAATTDSGGSSLSGYSVKVTKTVGGAVILNWGAITQSPAVQLTTSTLLDGSDYTIEVRALDMAGNISASASATWRVDLSNPTVDIAGAATWINSANDSAFVVSGGCSENGNAVNISAGQTGHSTTASGTCTAGAWSASLDFSAFNDASLVTISASHKDDANNEADATATKVKSFTINKDTVAPTAASAISLKDASNVVVSYFNTTAKTPYLHFTASSDSGSGIANQKARVIRVSDSHEMIVKNSATTAAQITVTLADTGVYKIELSATDLAGNSSTVANSANWTVDVTNPTVTITSHVANEKINLTDASSFTASGNCSEAGRNVVVSLTGAPSHSATVSCVSGSPNTWTASLGNITDKSEGNFDITVSHSDVAGNSINASRTVELDTVAPALSFTSDLIDGDAGFADIQTNDQTVNLTVVGADLVSYRWQMIAGAICPVFGDAGYQSKVISIAADRNIALSSLTDGNHRVCAFGYDAAGNATASISDIAWTNDSTAPSSISVTSSPSNVGDRSQIDFSAEPMNISLVADAAGVYDHATQFKYKFVDSLLDSCTNGAGYSTAYPISGGSHEMTAVSPSVSSFAEGKNLKLCLLGGDKLGNFQAAAASTTISWVKDLAPPVATLSGNLPGISSASNKLSIIVGDAVLVDGTDSVNVDPNPVKNYKVALNNAADCSGAVYGSTVSSATAITFGSLGSDGPKTICVKGIDFAGNEQITATAHSWIKDTVAPGAATLGLTHAVSTDDFASVSVSGLTDTDTYVWGISGGACSTNSADAMYTSLEIQYLDATPASKQFNVTGLGVGTTNICVLARDVAGNWSASAATSAVTVDAAAVAVADPEVELDSNTVPSGISAASWLAINVNEKVGFPSDLYKYSIVSGSDCNSATFGAHRSIASVLNDGLASLPDGQVTVCAKGKNSSTGVEQLIATSSSWTKESGANQMCIIAGDGGTSCWGANAHSQAGAVASESIPRASAVSIKTVSGDLLLSSQISLGSKHTCALAIDNAALTSAGQVYCWGSNDSGQLGNGSETDSLNGVLATNTGLTVFSQVVVGKDHTCGISSDSGNAGYVACWGSNSLGQTSQDTFTGNSNLPNRIKKSDGTPSGRQFSKIAAGSNHNCGISSNNSGKVYCWGLNSSGQLGDNSLTNRSSSVQAGNGTGYKDISSGGNHTCAIGNDDKVYCWGSNSAGQLGIIGGDLKVPTKVSDETYSKVFAGSDVTCGLVIGGTLKCWGSNSSGKLGVGSTALRISTPQTVGTGFTKVHVGGVFLAAQIGTRTKFWGSNSTGVIADKTTNLPGTDGSITEPPADNDKGDVDGISLLESY